MPSSVRLKILFEVIVLAASTGQAGCSEKSANGAAPAPSARAEVVAPVAFLPVDCNQLAPGAEPQARDVAARGRGLLAASGADYVLLLSSEGTPRYVLAEGGEACRTAHDKASCLAAVANLREGVTPPARPCRDERCAPAAFAITTRGDKVEAWSTGRELHRFIGTVDNLEEAWLIAHADQGSFPVYLCQTAASAFRKVDDGYELREEHPSKLCRPMERSEVVFHVTREGVAKESKRSVVWSDPNACAEGSERVQTAPSTP